MNISAWAIRQPVPSIVLFLVLIVLGLMSFKQLPITRFPNIDVPIVQIRVYQAGAAPTELESQVSKKIEDAIAGVNGIKHITSTITEGSSNHVVEFRLEMNPDRALNDIKDAVARVRSDLPKTVEEPIISRLEIEGLPILTYAARAPGMTPEQLSWFVDDVVIRALQGVKGVGSVARVGGVEREVRIVNCARPTSTLPADAAKSAGANKPSVRSPARTPSTNWRQRRSRCRAAAKCASTNSAGSSTPMPNRARSPRSTSSPWSRSRSCAPKAPATPSSQSTLRKPSPNLAKPIPTSN
jgi:hypothetical protein